MTRPWVKCHTLIPLHGNEVANDVSSSKYGHVDKVLIAKRPANEPGVLIDSCY